MNQGTRSADMQSRIGAQATRPFAHFQIRCILRKGVSKGRRSFGRVEFRGSKKGVLTYSDIGM